MGRLAALACLLASTSWAGPTTICPGGPDPLRFRPEAAVADTSSIAAPLAIDGCVDSVTGREWVAMAYLTAAGEVAVTVSGNGGCDFGAAGGGLAATIVSAAAISATPAVALRVDNGMTLLAVAWREADQIIARTTATLDGTFGAAAILESSARSAPRLALASAPAPVALAAAWLADAAGSRVARASIATTPLDPAAWPAATTLSASLAADLGTSSEIALAADAAGSASAGGFSIVATVTSTGAAHLARSDDGATFGAWRRIDDGSLTRPVSPSLAAGSGVRAWTATAWSGRNRTGPAIDRVVSDAALEDAGALAFDFDGASAQPNPQQASPVPSGTRTAVAAAGADPTPTAFVLWEDSGSGEIQAARRVLALARPQMSGGCPGFRMTGLSPARSTGRASAPVADALGADVVAAFVDDRSGTRQAYFKRSDSVAPMLTALVATPAACGPSPRIQLDWAAAPCDVASMVVEVGLSTGATDFTRVASSSTGLLVEGLQPGTTYFLRVRASDTAGNASVSEEVSAATASCSSALLRTSVLVVTDACAFGGAGGDGSVDPGETARVRVRVENVGTAVAVAATLTGLSRSATLSVPTGTIVLGDLPVGGTFDATIDVDVSATTACGSPLDVLLRCDVAGAAWGDLVTLPTGPPCTICRSASCFTTADGSRSGPNPICAGAQVTLDGAASTSGFCAGTRLFEWWDGGTLFSTNVAVNRQPGSSTTYRLVARCSTDLDCVSETLVPITVNPLPGLTLSEEPPAPHCEGDVVTIRATSPDPSSAFTWEDGATGPTHPMPAAGTLRCTALDSNGCSRSRTIRVDFGPVPPADAGLDVVGCGASVIGVPGFPLLDYRWDPPTGLSSRWVAQPRAAPSSATVYTLTVTDPTSGCSATDSVLVDVTPGPGPLQDLRVSRDVAEIVFSWTDPAASLATRIYSDVDASAAASANGSSASARLDCEGVGGCRESLPAESLIFFQAVSTCLDGINEGPN